MTSTNTEAKKQFPFEIQKSKEDDYVQVGPKKYYLSKKFINEADEFYNFQLRKDDVWILGYPRSGTTMTQELVWLLCNDLDFKKASKTILAERVPFFDRSLMFTNEAMGRDSQTQEPNDNKPNTVGKILKPAWKVLSEKNTNEQRLIKTHLPLSLLPPELLTYGCKVIYLARHPKDVAVSIYHFFDLFSKHGYKKTFAEHWDLFERGLRPWTPYFEHVKEAWETGHTNNLLFVFYEELNKNFRQTVQTIAEFLDKRLSEQDIQLLEDHFNISNFRNNKSVNNEYLKDSEIINKKLKLNFIRQGKVGGWRDYFDEDLDSRANDWIKRNQDTIDIIYPE